MNRSIAAFTALLAATAVMAIVWTQQPLEASQGPQQGGPDLVGGLKTTPGCLGVETARTRGGKNVIFAWFKDKEAIERWYYSETHQGVMDMFLSAGEGYQPDKPLAHIPDKTGPIMVIASLTPAEKGQIDGIDMPISQIAIELYQPLPGGAFFTSRFAPKEVEVEHMHDFTQPTKVLGSD